MSLGYVKGRYWVTDDMFAKYKERPSYKKFLEACRLAGFAILCEYSYTGQQYTAEIITYTKMTHSPNYYFFKHNNAYDRNPLAAMGRAAVESDYATPLVRACVLEMEVELLADAYKAAVEREQRQAALEAKLEGVLDGLRMLLPSAWELSGVLDMHIRELVHVFPGIRIEAVKNPTVGVPAGYDEDDWHGDIPLGQAKSPRPIPAAPDEDDDL